MQRAFLLFCASLAVGCGLAGQVRTAWGQSTPELTAAKLQPPRQGREPGSAAGAAKQEPAAEEESSTSDETASELAELFAEFAAKPDRESYLAVRDVLVASEYYNSNSDELNQAQELALSGEWEAAQEVLDRSRENLILSPLAYMVRSQIAAELGDEETAEAMHLNALACCEGILATGDGTSESPYLVVRVSDEYDLLAYLQKEPDRQGLVNDGDRVCDVLTCADGTEIWFDIKDAFESLSRSLLNGPESRDQ